MKQFWKKRMPAALLALIMMISLVPLAGAENFCPNGEHSWKATDTKPATCTDAGYEKQTCEKCPATQEVTLKPLGHNFGDWKVVTPATCTTDGLTEQTCSRCQQKNSQVIPKTGHKWVNNGSGTPATCGKNGSQPQICTTCNATQTATLPATGAHSWNSGVITTNPTCTATGVKTYTCTVCLTTKTEVIPAKGHSVNSTTGRCTVCGQQINNVGYSVNYYYLTTSGYYPSTTYKTYQVPVNSYAGSYAPSTPTVTVGGKTYTFKGWTTVPYSGSTGYLYTNQYLIPMHSYLVTSNTNFYAVYTTNDSATITYTVDPGKRTSFDSRDFYNAYRNQYNGTLNYVVFNVSRSTYDNFSGAVYSGNSVLTYSDLNNSRFYYSRSDAGRNDYALDDLTLEASSNAKDDSMTMGFTAYGTWGTMNGTIKLTVGDEKVSNKTIIYKVTPGKSVDFDRSDFNTVYQTVYPNETMGYVVFDRPDSSAFSYGTLYSNYGKSSQTKFTRSDLNDAYFYYNGGYAVGRNDYALDNLTFAADTGFKSTVTMDFTVYGLNNSRSVTGKVEIRSSESTEDSIVYKVTPGRTVSVSRADFLNYLRKTYSNETLDYVVFDRPSSNAFSYGTLYNRYNTTSQTMFTQSDLSSATFYYEARNATGRYDYALDDLTFVADSRFSTAVELSFTAYDDDRDHVKGTLIFQPEGATASSNYVGSVRYNTTANTLVQINANDIARYYNKSTGGTLQYVTLTGVPSTGSLYYNYYGASKYGSASRLQLTSANAGTQPLYFNPSSTAQYALTELTYVPSGSNYCVTIPFTAYGTFSSVTGAILISVSRSAVSEIYGTTLRNTAVSFPASGIYSAVLSATGSALYSIQLLSLPASNQGTVYVGSGTSNRANTTSQYTYASGVNAISQLRFVPAASYTGSVEIPYVALNSSGAAIASGVFSIGVVNTRRSYTDVTSSTWCYKYVTELADAGVISGYKDGSFKPASTISYGAALKLVMRAAGYPELAPTNKTSVFSGYLARAQADGLVTRSNINLAAPITRLQVAQLAAGALKLSTSNLSSVKPFTDTSDLYVQALNAAGIVEGYFSNGTSTFRPNNTLNRGQVSAIVWRMQNYRK